MADQVCGVWGYLRFYCEESLRSLIYVFLVRCFEFLHSIEEQVLFCMLRFGYHLDVLFFFVLVFFLRYGDRGFKIEKCPTIRPNATL